MEEEGFVEGGFLPLLAMLAEAVIIHLVTEIAFNPKTHSEAWERGRNKAYPFDEPHHCYEATAV